MMMFVWFVVIATLVIACWLIVSRSSWWSGVKKQFPRESPEEILRRRFAGGEIDRETYERMMRDIAGPTSQSSSA